ncbi:MAG: lipoate--protein ligase family protein, partial [Bacteroidales bacterium]|nr:lipoate--protein ligase family protein [Bacteroidales bacterium]
MLCINRNETDPWFNLAAEEYVLRSFTDDCFMLWRNEPSIIVGKHQNTLAEINHNFVREHGIRVVRRISGGGAVYHDQGNINFSFVANGEKDKLVDFRRFTKPILEVLVNLGVDARFEGHNDLKINGMKFSGNAEHVYKNRVLHHGTLLFDSDLEMINQALTIDSEKFSDKAVKSIRSKVKNISYHLPGQMEITDFMDIVLNHVLKSHPDATLYSFDELDYERIEELVRTKYST